MCFGWCFIFVFNRLIWRSHYIISCSMSTSGAGPSSSSSRVQHQQGSNSSSGQTEANGTTTPSPPPQSSTNPATTATPPVKEAKEAKPNPKMSKALSTSAKRYFFLFFFLQTHYYNLTIHFRIQKELAEITLDPPPNCRYKKTKNWCWMCYWPPHFSVLDPKVTICMNGSLPFSVLPGRFTKVGCFSWTFTSLPSIPSSHPR